MKWTHFSDRTQPVRTREIRIWYMRSERESLVCRWLVVGLQLLCSRKWRLREASRSARRWITATVRVGTTRRMIFVARREQIGNTFTVTTESEEGENSLKRERETE